MKYFPTRNKNKQKYPLLFLHGAYCDSIVWKENFLDYFVDAGFDCYILDFKVEDTVFTIFPTTLNTYVEQVVKAIEQIGTTPILIGHSMAGAVMQKLYKTKKMEFPAWVLLTPAPPRDFYESSPEMLFDNPVLFSQMYLLQMLGTNFVSPSLVKLALFADDFDEKKAFSYISKFKPMPSSLIFDVLTLNIKDEDLKVNFPVLLQAAKYDKLVSEKNIKMIENTYNIKAKYYNSGHAIMLDKDWEKAAKDIEDFISNLS